MLNEAFDRHRAGEHEEAERLYREILAADDTRHDAHHLLAVLKQEQGKLDEAMTHAERALELADDQASYHLTLCAILHSRGDLGGARVNAERAVALDPNIAEGHNTLGYLQYVQGDLDDAETSLRLALKVQPDSPSVLNNMGLVHLAAGRIERARARFEQALAIEPDDLGARTGLGRTFLAEGAAGFAEQCFRQALERHPDSVMLKQLLADALVANERPDEAKPLYGEVLKALPGSFRAQVGLADIASAQGRPAEAARLYTQALARRRGDVPTIVKLGEALLAAGQAEAARHCFQRLLDQGQRSAAVRIGHARSRLAAGAVADAIGELTDVLAELPGHRDAALALATAHGAEDDHERAVEILRELPEAEREATSVRFSLTRHLILAGHPNDAIEALGELPTGGHDALVALELAGRACDEHGDHAEAAEHFQRLAAEAEAPPPNLPSQREGTDASAWPKSPPEDGRGEPVFLLGLPGSGVDAVAAALASLDRVDVLADRGRPDSLRQDFLSRRERDLGNVDEHRLLMTRRRYWNGVRHARTKLVEGIAGVDHLPPEQCDPLAIARFFPGATLLLVTRDPADHLLHAETFGWRDGVAPTALDLEEFYGQLAVVARDTGVRVVPVDFDTLRSGDDAALRSVFGPLEIPIDGFEEALQGQLYDADGLHRYWARGHAAHYAEAFALDDDTLAVTREALASLAGDEPTA